MRADAMMPSSLYERPLFRFRSHELGALLTPLPILSRFQFSSISLENASASHSLLPPTSRHENGHAAASAAMSPFTSCVYHRVSSRPPRLIISKWLLLYWRQERATSYRKIFGNKRQRRRRWGAATPYRAIVAPPRQRPFRLSTLAPYFNEQMLAAELLMARDYSCTALHFDCQICN